MRIGRTISVVGGVAVTAALVATGAVLATRPAARPPAPATAAGLPASIATDALGRSIATSQQRLRLVPTDWTAWAQLGGDYVQQARLTADPTYYPKADGAFARSLDIRPRGNDLALTGQASLAAGRHDFAGALRLADAAIDINAYSSTAYGVKSDALIELGRYPAAFAAIQRMDDLRPGVPSFTRVSYAFELQGNLPAARETLRRALTDATAPADSAFALYYLGELAWNAGDLVQAGTLYAQGLARDPAYLPLLEGRAKVEAATGQADRAVDDYRTVVSRLPQPQYVIELTDLYTSLGRAADAAQQADLVRTEETLFRSQGVNVDLELALFDADHGRPGVALTEATAEWRRRKSVLVEDAYAWALHVNGRDAAALPHARSALRLGFRSALLTYHLGMIEAALHQPGPAVRDLTAALGINPHFNPVQAPLARAELHRLSP